jgi:alanine racemase
MWRCCGPSPTPAAVWAVVKANGYGHGSVEVARAALDAGAEGLCVALTAEGVTLRRAGIAAPDSRAHPAAGVRRAGDRRPRVSCPTVYTAEYGDALAAAASGGAPVGVHLKIDTGMQRVGAAPSSVTAVARHLAALAPALRVDAVFTHLACADEPTDPSNAQQLSTFDAALDELSADRTAAAGGACANSAAALAIPEARRSIVRAGIALYGISPARASPVSSTSLRPVMSLRARVSYVKRVAAGSHVSYGWRHRFAETTTVATVPIGYADGVPRRLGTLPDRPAPTC